MVYATPTLTLPPQGGGDKSKDTLNFHVHCFYCCLYTPLMTYLSKNYQDRKGHLTLIVSKTPSKFVKTSLFQNLKMLYPSANEPVTSLLILLHFNSMLTAINFQDQALFQTDKISNISANRMLPPKPESLYLFPS